MNNHDLLIQNNFTQKIENCICIQTDIKKFCFIYLARFDTFCEKSRRLCRVLSEIFQYSAYTWNTNKHLFHLYLRLTLKSGCYRSKITHYQIASEPHHCLLKSIFVEDCLKEKYLSMFLECDLI